MNGNTLLECLNDIDSELILEAEESISRFRIKKQLLTAASIFLMVFGMFHVVMEYGLFASGCGAYPGEIVDGIYYYQDGHNGVWSYSPKTGSQKEIYGYGLDFWEVDEYALYYVKGRSLYAKPHDSEKRILLYRADFFESTHMMIDLYEEQMLRVTVYNKRTKIKSSFYLDGKTGEIIEMLYDSISYYDRGIYEDEPPYHVGDRELYMVRVEESKNDVHYELYENGSPVLPAGVHVFNQQMIGGNLVICYGVTNTFFEGLSTETTYGAVLCPDGSWYDIPPDLCSFDVFQTGTNEYLFKVLYEPEGEGLWCYEITTGEYWQIADNTEYTHYSAVTDGKHVYTCAPWDEEQLCWELIYQNGKPHHLELVSEDIRNS